MTIFHFPGIFTEKCLSQNVKNDATNRKIQFMAAFQKMVKNDQNGHFTFELHFSKQNTVRLLTDTLGCLEAKKHREMKKTPKSENCGLGRHQTGDWWGTTPRVQKTVLKSSRKKYLKTAINGWRASGGGTTTWGVLYQTTTNSIDAKFDSVNKNSFCNF